MIISNAAKAAVKGLSALASPSQKDSPAIARDVAQIGASALSALADRGRTTGEILALAQGMRSAKLGKSGGYTQQEWDAAWAEFAVELQKALAAVKTPAEAMQGRAVGDRVAGGLQGGHREGA